MSHAGAHEITEEIADVDPTAELAPPYEESSDEESLADVGQVVADRYLVEGRLGTGGTANILKARDLHGNGEQIDGGHIAIKMLRPELRFRAPSIARLQREFRQTRLVGHPNVVRQFGIGCDRGSWFIAMELLNGEPLGRRLRDRRPNGLSMNEALKIAAACGDVLACAHDKGVTHGDVKPDNVFVSDQGVRMIDFGAAPSARAAAAQPPAATIAPAATRAYASPEVLAGLKPEPRDDVFSLACVIYEMLAGRHPYSRLGADEARDLGLRIEPIPGLDPAQSRALTAGLAWVRDARPDSVRELLLGFAPPAVAEVIPAPVDPMPPPKATQRSALPVIVPTTRLPVRPLPERLSGRAPRVRLATGSWRPSLLQPRFRPIFALGALVIVMGLFAIFGGGWQSGGSSDVEREIAARPAPTATSVAAAPPPAAVAVKPAPEPAPVRKALAAPPLPQASFKDTELVVSRGTVSAAIPIQLQPGKARARVAWRTIDGSAVAGRDYSGPTSGVAQFQERQTDRILYVPIVTDASADADRSFTVELTGAPAGARLGSPRRVTVTIRGGG